MIKKKPTKTHDKNVAIFDFGMGNLWSLKNALNFIGLEADFISNSEELLKYKKAILPGVGSFKEAMIRIKKKKFDLAINKFLSNNKNKLLCICLGMQLLGNSSTENGFSKGLNIINNKVSKFKSTKKNNIKIPHIGFNKVHSINNFFLDLKITDYDFYFNHSYKMNLENLNLLDTYAICNYRIPFLAGFRINNIIATQFHPEKSQKNGLKLLHNIFNNN